MSYHPNKHFGQHFLNHPRYLEKIVSALSPQPDDILIEIGPGMGALTKQVIEYCNHLHVIEIDKRFIEYLETHLPAHKVTVHNQNALKFDFSTLLQPNKQLRIFGNLPYNISTPLMFHFLKFKDHLQDMLFLLQSEVVDRMIAEPGNKTYGRLSVMMQYHCQGYALFDVPPKAFHPPPKVNSTVIKLIPHVYPQPCALDYAVFENVVNLAFQQRRKVIRNSLRSVADEALLSSVQIDPGLRPEVLTVADFVRISNAVVNRQR